LAHIRSPALRALAVQSVALCGVAGIALLNLTTLAAPISLLWFCVLQAVLATACSILLRDEIWWRYIHFIFPIAAYATQQLALPSLTYLFAFLFLLILFTASFKNRVPYFPSNQLVWERVHVFLQSRNATNLIDLGSGLGGLVLHLKQKNPALTVIGIELAPLPWIISLVRKVFTRSKAKFLIGDYEALNFGQFDAIFAYLSPAPMEHLYAKALREMRKDTLLLSHEFPVPHIKPSYLLDSPKGESPTYVYVL
jgi:hypothetical protein